MEMRSASRRRSTFGLRLLFALAGTAACLVVLALPHLPTARKGQTMLVLLSFLSLLFCLAAGGFLTSDCVSSEKREGTLGLLFLTPLNGLDIVLGKLVCHGLQTFYGVCAVFPVFFLPLLTGGVTWAEVSRIVLALALALFVSAAVGMLVSILGTDSRRTILTTFTSTTLLASLPMLYLMVRSIFWRALPHAPVQLSPVFSVLAGFDASYRSANGPAMFWGSLIALSALGLGLVIISAFLLGKVFRRLGTGAGSLAEAPRTRPPGRALQAANPYEWAILENADQGSSLGYLTTLALLFFAAMVLVSLNTSHWQEGFTAAFFTAFALHVISKLRLAVEATLQINADHQSGALELLLVTPLSEESILRGHRSAQRSLSRKPLLLLVGVNLVLEACVLFFPDTLQVTTDNTIAFSTIFLGGAMLALADFAALRWGGFLSGLRSPSHARAVLLTFGSVMVLPWAALGLAFAWLTSVSGSSDKTITHIVLAWVGMSLAYDLFLIRRCRKRLNGRLRLLASESA